MWLPKRKDSQKQDSRYTQKSQQNLLTIYSMAKTMKSREV